MQKQKELFVFSLYRYMDSFIRYVHTEKSEKNRYSPEAAQGDKVCIVLDKGLGDFILFSYYLKLFIEYYSKSREVYVIADEYNVKFLTAYIFKRDFEVIILKKGRTETVDGRELSEFRGIFEIAIIPMNAVTPRSAQIIRTLSPRDVYSLGNARFLRKYSLLDYNLFKKIKNFDIPEQFYCKMHREFYCRLTGETCGYELLSPNVGGKIEKRAYFLLNISASNPIKLLPLDKFLQIGCEISKYSGLLPILIGDMPQNILKLVDNSIFDCNYVNCRDVGSVASLCKYAEFVITSDTGIYHLALSIKDGPRVIIPTWSYYNVLFEPYPEEMTDEYQRVVYIRMYDSCKVCPHNGILCFYRKCKKETVHCVADMSVGYILRKIEGMVKI